MNYQELENVLEVYTLEEILEYNDLAATDALQFLLEQRFIELPEPTPL